MKLALIGYPIQHSLSPKMYKEILGSKLTTYDLLEFKHEDDIPTLLELSKKYDGLNITAPYKKHFFNDVLIDSEIVKSIEAINVIAFKDSEAYGTNTDVIAVEHILSNYKERYPFIRLIILGSGVMAKVTIMIAKKLEIPFWEFNRHTHPDLAVLDLEKFHNETYQTIVINCCSRDFIFKGILHPNYIFWDYNYAFIPHQNSLPSNVKQYIDGEDMLFLQAKAAVQFWQVTNPKLKC